MIFSLMAGRGKLGEYYVKDLAPNDFLVQLIGLWDNLEKNYHLLDEKTIQLCASVLSFIFWNCIEIEEKIK